MQKQYDKDFKIMVCELMASGQSPKSLAQEYGMDESSVRKWKKQYDGDKEAFTGTGNPSLTPLEKENRELKKQLKETALERDILKKAVAIFSAGDRRNIGS